MMGAVGALRELVARGMPGITATGALPAPPSPQLPRTGEPKKKTDADE